MTPLEHFEAEYATIRRTKDGKAYVNLAWNSALRTLRERGAVYALRLHLAPEPPAGEDRSLRYMGYWRNADETDLMALLDRLHRLVRHRI